MAFQANEQFSILTAEKVTAWEKKVNIRIKNYYNFASLFIFATSAIASVANETAMIFHFSYYIV